MHHEWTESCPLHTARPVPFCTRLFLWPCVRNKTRWMHIYIPVHTALWEESRITSRNKAEEQASRSKRIKGQPQRTTSKRRRHEFTYSMNAPVERCEQKDLCIARTGRRCAVGLGWMHWCAKGGCQREMPKSIPIDRPKRTLRRAKLPKHYSLWAHAKAVSQSMCPGLARREC